jgi:hypothetical protein
LTARPLFIERVRIEQRSSLYGLLRIGRTRSGRRLLRRANSIRGRQATRVIAGPAGAKGSFSVAGTGVAATGVEFDSI